MSTCDFYPIHILCVPRRVCNRSGHSARFTNLKIFMHSGSIPYYLAPVMIYCSLFFVVSCLNLYIFLQIIKLITDGVLCDGL